MGNKISVFIFTIKTRYSIVMYSCLCVLYLIFTLDASYGRCDVTKEAVRVTYSDRTTTQNLNCVILISQHFQMAEVISI